MRTRILSTLLIWLAAVVSVAGIVWFAIDAAGRQVFAATMVQPLAGAPIAATAADEPESVAVEPSADSENRPENENSKSVPSAPSSTSKSVPSEGAITQEHAEEAMTSTYSTDGGRVQVRCEAPESPWTAVTPSPPPAGRSRSTPPARSRFG